MTDYRALNGQLAALIGGVPHRTANLANASALLYHTLDGLNWAGFYLREGDTLVLGPFQGKPACIEIPMGRGVCGTAAAEDRTQLVRDVHRFPGHIACDSASNSEIVVPIHADGTVVGVLDLDSPHLGRFTEEDQAGLEEFVRILETEGKMKKRNLVAIQDRGGETHGFFKGLPYYWGAIAVTKCIKAILFVFLPGKSSDRATLDACTGWVRHVGRFYESRPYTFVFDARLTSGEAEVLLLDEKKQTVLKLGRQSPSQTVTLDGRTNRYYLRWEFHSASGKCELRW